MELKEKKWVVSLEKGNGLDLRKEAIGVLRNGEDSKMELSDLFVRHTLEKDAIVGYSLLQFFTLKDKVLIDKEGNHIQLFLRNTKTALYFTEVTKKFVALDPIHVPVSVIEAFSDLLIGIKDPEAIFTGLSASEKAAMAEGRKKKDSDNAVKYETDLAALCNQKADTALMDITDESIAKANESFSEYQTLPLAKEATVKEIGDKITLAQQKRDEQKSAVLSQQEKEKNTVLDMANKAVESPSEESIHKASECLAQYQKLENASKETVEAASSKIAQAEEAFENNKQAAQEEAKEKARKAKVNPKFLYTPKDYYGIKEDFAGMGGTEIVKDEYHFFHAPQSEEEKDPTEPILLIKRGKDWWEEPEDAEVWQKTPTAIMLRFKDDKKEKLLTFDTEKESLSVEDFKK